MATTLSASWRRLAASVATAVALVLPLAVIGAPAAMAEDEAGDPSRLVVSTDQSVENWNPFVQIYMIEHQFRQVQYESLIVVGADDFSYEGQLAESWEESEDGLTWTFHLRPEATWHDGKPVTAQDVAYTFHILLHDKVISTRNADAVALIDSVEAVDDQTVEFTLNNPAPIDFADVQVMPKHVWEKHEGEWSDYANDEFPIIGSGPFQAVEFETDQFIRYEANKDYWGGAPGFDELVFQYYAEPDSAVAALEAGEVDLVMGLNEAQIKRLDTVEGITTNVAPDRRYTGLAFNTGAETADGEPFGNGNPALKDVKVRQALHYAIDKQELIDRVRGGHGIPATSIVPEIFEEVHWGPDEGDTFGYDPEEAGRLLDEAGYPLGADGVRTTPDGDPLVLRFGVDAGMAERENAALFIIEWWEAIGVKVDQTISEDVQDQYLDGKLDVTFTGWGIGPNPFYNLNRQTCGMLPTDPGVDTSDAFYCDQHYSDLADQLVTESDPETRTELMAEMQEILYVDAPQIALWYPTVMEAYNSDKVTGMVTQPTSGGGLYGQMGPWAYRAAQPTGESSGGTSTGVLVGVGVVVLLAVAGGAVVLVRRRKSAGERE